MKKIGLLVFMGIGFGVFAYPSDRKKSRKPSSSVATQGLELAKSDSDKSLKRSRKVAAKEKAKETLPEPRVQAAPSQLVAAMVAAPLPLEEGDEAWKRRRLTKDDVESIIAAWPEKQRFMMNYLATHGFSKLAAAYFVALSEEDVLDLLKNEVTGEIDQEEMCAMLVAPAFTEVSGDLQLMSLLPHIPSLLCGSIGKTPEELLKWLVRRSAIWGAPKDILGVHVVMYSGLFDIFVDMPEGDMPEFIEAVSASSATPLAVAALASQSQVVVDWCVKAKILDTQLAKINSFDEDSAVLTEWLKAQLFTPAMIGKAMGLLTSSGFGFGGLMAGAFAPLQGLLSRVTGGSRASTQAS